MTLALTFPGQGSQSVGMLDAFVREKRPIRETFERAASVIGYDLWSLVRDGPESQLNETTYTQPAMLAAGVAIWTAWRESGGPRPDVVAGHSLGEFSALVCAQCLTFEDAVGVVAARARFMQDAVPVGTGGVAAILGLDDEVVESVCSAISDGSNWERVWAVNYNAPGQVVVAGHASAVDEACARAREEGARRAIRLPLSVPVHCPLMRPSDASTARRAGRDSH